MKLIRWTSLMLVLAVVGCDQWFTEPERAVVLESLEFTKSEAVPGGTLVLRAQARDPGAEAPLLLSLGTSTGEQAQDTADILTWRDFPAYTYTDEQMLAWIAEGDGWVAVGFKEADAERGYDENSRVVVTRETMERMKRWVQEQGVVIEEDLYIDIETNDGYGGHPLVYGWMPIELELVRTLRSHINVDYIEGQALVHDLDSGEEDANPAYIAVIPTHAGDGEGLLVRSGDTVTATYRQPDGSRLTAQITIR